MTGLSESKTGQVTIHSDNVNETDTDFAILRKISEEKISPFTLVPNPVVMSDNLGWLHVGPFPKPESIVTQDDINKQILAQLNV